VTDRLRHLGLLPTASRPSYNRDSLRPGIIHIGPGAFFRAHIGAFTDSAIETSGGGWGIEAFSLRSTEVADNLDAQNGLYTLLIRESSGTSGRVIGSVLSARVAPRDPIHLLSRLEDPEIRIVSLTVTEKAYGLDSQTGGLDHQHPDIGGDLSNPHSPRGVIGYLVEGLSRRRKAGVSPFTPLCCDNLPNNGAILKRLVVEFSERIDPSLSAWIRETVPFPSTMVDRITPASTDQTYADARRLVGFDDLAAVETEPFAQWVIEDNFACGRPDWGRIPGAVLVEEVSAYEKMKLRMLNGTHSLLAYLGFLNGHEFVRDAMEDAEIEALVRRHIKAAASTLGPVPGIDLSKYGNELVDRFANRAIAHRTYQIAMDGTQKLSQRLLEPAAEILKQGGDVQTYAMGVAAWMRYAIGIDRRGHRYDLRDPRSLEIARRLSGLPCDGLVISQALFKLPGLLPRALVDNVTWSQSVAACLQAQFDLDQKPEIST